MVPTGTCLHSPWPYHWQRATGGTPSRTRTAPATLHQADVSCGLRCPICARLRGRHAGVSVVRDRVACVDPSGPSGGSSGSSGDSGHEAASLSPALGLEVSRPGTIFGGIAPPAGRAGSGAESQGPVTGGTEVTDSKGSGCRPRCDPAGRSRPWALSRVSTGVSGPRSLWSCS